MLFLPAAQTLALLISVPWYIQHLGRAQLVHVPSVHTLILYDARPHVLNFLAKHAAPFGLIGM